MSTVNMGKQVTVSGRLVGEVEVIANGDKLCLQDGGRVVTVYVTGAIMAAVLPGLVEGVRLHLEGCELPSDAGEDLPPLIWVYRLRYSGTEPAKACSARSLRC